MEKKSFPSSITLMNFSACPAVNFRFTGIRKPNFLRPGAAPSKPRSDDWNFCWRKGTASLSTAMYFTASPSFSQLRPEDRCRCPNIVFSGELIAPADHLIYQKYIGPLLSSRQLPCVILKPSIPWQNSILSCLDRLFSLMQKHALKEERRPLPLLSFDSPADDSPCWEMQVQNELNRIWQLLISHVGEIPPVNIEKGEASLQIRMQKMLAFIRSHYASPVSLDQIAASASISKSEASRCFQAYMNQPPVSYLLDFRLEKAKQLLSSTPDTVEEISRKCGFRSSGYFCRIFKRRTGASPNQYRRETT